jgi:hypothetical protein
MHLFGAKYVFKTETRLPRPWGGVTTKSSPTTDQVLDEYTGDARLEDYNYSTFSDYL